jgi:DNA primase
LVDRIPETTISEIRNASDIVDIISEVVLLKRAGKNFLGLCPFHSEKTPSFTVSSDKQIFYCFGCGAGGNVFTFLMKHEGFSFPEAVRMLGRRHGIAVEDRQLSLEERQRMREREGIFDVNEQAAAFFQRMLLENQEGRSALDYLRKRGTTLETIDRFSLGYAPSGWDALAGYFAGRRVSAELLEKSGLGIPRKKGGGVYDRFRNRIVFPIVGASSRVVGFGGRVMDDSLPKYLNSPETAVFNKRRSLYGLEAARARCRETGTVYVVEGYFDVLALSQADILNAVATLGTALSPEHVRILKGYVREIVLVYDSDQAGIRAAQKSVETFRKENMDARILVLPEGHDPDSFILKFGPKAFRETARAARNMMDFLMEETVRKHGLSVEGKLRIIEEMREPLSAVSDRMARSLYIRNLAEHIGVDEARVASRIRRVPAPGRTDDRRRETFSDARGLSGKNGFLGRHVRIERKIITMMLQFQDFLVEIDRRNLLDFFEDERLKSIGEHILMHYKTTGEHHVSGFIENLDETEREITVNLAIGGDVWDREGCLRLLAQFESGRKRQKDNLLQRIEAASRNNDQALLLELLKEKQNQARKRQTIN